MATTASKKIDMVNTLKAAEIQKALNDVFGDQVSKKKTTPQNIKEWIPEWKE
jgi:hypothetical protein